MQIKISTRLVILTKRRAYKIPISRRGWLQGKNEKFIWDKYKEHQLLAPLVWELFGIVCQKRINPIEYLSEWNVINIKHLMHEFDFDNCDLYRLENWGYHEGECLLIDYGVNKRISRMYKTKKND